MLKQACKISLQDERKAWWNKNAYEELHVAFWFILVLVETFKIGKNRQILLYISVWVLFHISERSENAKDLKTYNMAKKVQIIWINA